MRDRFSIDDLEADLGLNVALRVLMNCGGQARKVPSPANAARSSLAREIGTDAAFWLAARFGGEEINFPSRHGRDRGSKAARLLADVIDAGLTEPTKSANDLARAHGVSARHIKRLRADLRDGGMPPKGRSADHTDLPLFRHG